MVIRMVLEAFFLEHAWACVSLRGNMVLEASEAYLSPPWQAVDSFDIRSHHSPHRRSQVQRQLCEVFYYVPTMKSV
jgi:hypothetical protein